MASSIFDPQNSFWSPIGKFTDVLVLSLLWFLCSLPLFTIGAATTALYDAVSHCVRGGDNGPWSRFFRTFRREFATSTVVTLVWGILLSVLGTLLHLLWMVALDGAGLVVAMVYSFLFLLIPVGAACWMFPLLSRFTFRPAGLITTSLRFAIGYLPYTLVIVAIAVLAALAVWALWILIFALPCITALLWAPVMERAFQKYMPEE